MGNRWVLRLAALAVGLALVGSAAPAFGSIDKSSVSSSKLKALTSTINKAKHLTYEATYKSVQGGQTTTVTIAQAPPKSYFGTSGGSVINDGSKTSYCSGSGSTQQCVSTGGTNPFVGLEGLFSPSLALAAFAEAKEGLGSKALGVKVSETSATIGGQASTCVNVTVRGQGGKYCVTKQGLLSYSGSSSTAYFALTSYTKSPPSSLFALPAGATQITLPPGVTLPGGGTIP
jgi:hypothetical protein